MSTLFGTFNVSLSDDSLLHIPLALQCTMLILYVCVELLFESSFLTDQMNDWEHSELGLLGAHPEPCAVPWVLPQTDVQTCRLNWHHDRQHPVVCLRLWLETPPWMLQLPTADCLFPVSATASVCLSRSARVCQIGFGSLLRVHVLL